MGVQKPILCLLACLFAPCAFAARRVANYQQATKQGNSTVKIRSHGACQCLLESKCSSCTFTTCPINDPIEYFVEAFEGGGSAALNGVAAWRLTLKDTNADVRVSHKEYVIKFGGPMEEPVLAAQLGHAMGVVTPRQLVVDISSCPSLWKLGSGDDTSVVPPDFVRSLKQRQGKQVSIQELAWENLALEQRNDEVIDMQVAQSTTKTSLSSPVSSNIWYEAGLIAAMDWIIGKSDLFNDVDLRFQETVDGMDDIDSNVGNLLIRIDGNVGNHLRCLAIDLDVDMELTRWDLWKPICEQLKGQLDSHDTSILPWLKKVLLPMLTLVKTNGGSDLGVQNPKNVFGIMDFATFIGYDQEVSFLLMQMGLIDGISRAMFVTSDQYTLADHPEKEKFKALPGFSKGGLDSWTEADREKLQTLSAKYFDKVSKLQAAGLEAASKRKELESHICCQVQCSRERSNLAGFSFAGTYQETCDEKHIKEFVPKYLKFKPKTGSLNATQNERGCEGVAAKRKGAAFFAAEIQLQCKSMCKYGDEKRPVKLKQLIDVDMQLCR